MNAEAEVPRAVARVRVERLGRVGYAHALERQRALAAARAAGEAPDTLLVLEHEPVITLGRSARREHVLLSEAALEAEGIDLVACDRGGDVTYHGPGQVVLYPILDLAPDRCDVRRYVHDLEEVMIRTCARYGLAAQRKEGMIGCWLGGEGPEDPWRKIGAIGVHLSRWITTHGLAFNVDPRMEHFARIVPCGIGAHPVTALARELVAPPAFDEVREALVESFAEVFGAALVEG